MPYKSDRQRRYMNYAAKKGKIPQNVVDEFNESSKGMNPPGDRGPEMLAFGGWADDETSEHGSDYMDSQVGDYDDNASLMGFAAQQNDWVYPKNALAMGGMVEKDVGDYGRYSKQDGEDNAGYDDNHMRVKRMMEMAGHPVSLTADVGAEKQLYEQMPHLTENVEDGENEVGMRLAKGGMVPGGARTPGALEKFISKKQMKPSGRDMGKGFSKGGMAMSLMKSRKR